MSAYKGMRLWTNKMLVEFLELYENEPCIWDRNHPEHKCRPAIIDAWARIHNNISFPCTLLELKRKKESIMTSYRFHARRIKQNPEHRVLWFLFPYLNKFLGKLYCEDASDSEDFQNVVPKTEEHQVTYSNNTSVERPRRKRSRPVIRSVYSTSTPNNHTPAPQRTENSSSLFKTKDDDITEMDECELYGQLLARKLRRLDERQRDLAMHEIDNIMFRAKMKTDESQALKRSKSPVFILTPQNEEQYDEEYLEDPIHDEC